jgi:hypothetical protein
MKDEKDYEIHQNKRLDKTYISRSLSFINQNDRRIRTPYWLQFRRKLLALSASSILRA